MQCLYSDIDHKELIKMNNLDTDKYQIYIQDPNRIQQKPKIIKEDSLIPDEYSEFISVDRSFDTLDLARSGIEAAASRIMLRIKRPK